MHRYWGRDRYRVPHIYFTCGGAIAECGQSEVNFSSGPLLLFLRKNYWFGAKTNTKWMPTQTQSKIDENLKGKTDWFRSGDKTPTNRLPSKGLWWCILLLNVRILGRQTLVFHILPSVWLSSHSKFEHGHSLETDVYVRSLMFHFTQNILVSGGAVANRLRRRTSDQTVLGSNPAVAAALSPWTRLFTPIVPSRSLHISFY